MEGTELKRVWSQREIPVILRRTGKGEKLRARIPRARGDFDWLRNGRHQAPFWNSDLDCWELPKAWFNDFVERALGSFGRVYVIQPYREEEKCSPACQNAHGHECECSCMGQYHGAGNDGTWFEVSETFATRWSDPQLACRLMTVKRT
jgi:hypothetical protein